MNRLLTLLAFCCLAFTAGAQTSAQKLTLPPMDKSPMDMAYYPANYPVLKIQDKATEPLLARAIYSRPQKAGRVVFGELVPLNEVWRLGANEASEIEFFREVRIGGRKLAKGKYTIYAIVSESQWTVIFNKETDTWGAFKYDEKKDAARITVPVEALAEPVEPFTLLFEKTAAGPALVIAWDKARVSVPIGVTK
ncbi:MAG: DUF2911 domain-containing protein [Chitinophagaceae bacterium]|nr:MAG: DUF2911 domain-containing protein [Chitinophagaceae bacterium]